MKTLLIALYKIISGKFTKLIFCILTTLKEVFSYMNAVKKECKEKERQEKISQTNKELCDVIDNGTLEELIDVTKKCGEA
jgi:hypothetical protein